VALGVAGATEVDSFPVPPVSDTRLVARPPEGPSAQRSRAGLGGRGGARRKVLIADGSVDAVQYVSRHLIFHRFGVNEGVWAVPFGEGAIDLGPSKLVAAGVRSFAAAEDGTLILRWSASRAKVSLVWIDRKGAAPTVAGPSSERASGAALSPNGRRAAFFVSSERGPSLIVRDLQTGVETRLAVQAGDAKPVRASTPPVWFPSGDRVMYTRGGIEASK